MRIVWGLEKKVGDFSSLLSAHANSVRKEKAHKAGGTALDFGLGLAGAFVTFNVFCVLVSFN